MKIYKRAVLFTMYNEIITCSVDFVMNMHYVKTKHLCKQFQYIKLYVLCKCTKCVQFYAGTLEKKNTNLS